MTPRTAQAAAGRRILDAFRAAGALEVAPDVLLPADTLLDLYGEDIRARAYITDDPLRGEVVLRPDFTVPIVQMHMAGGAEPARYCYLGEVFRKQDPGETRPAQLRANEYLQVGLEVFDRNAPAADAEVFGVIHRLLAPLGLTAVMGDMGLVRDAILALPLAQPRREALLHHIWRPARFARLLDRYASPGAPPALDGGADVPWTGRRRPDEVATRIAQMQADAAEPPLPAEATLRLHATLSLSGPADAALAALQAQAADQPRLAPAEARLAARLAGIAAAGIDLGTIRFDAGLGRETMEYYDGMTFTFVDPADPDGPPVASGGRYDRLTAELGRGRAIPAVGGIIRPALVAAREAAPSAAEAATAARFAALGGPSC